MAKALVLVRLNEKIKLLTTLRTQTAKTPRSDGVIAILGATPTLDHRQIAAERRASSDEQVKQPSQNAIARKLNKFSGARKTPAENSARLKSPRAPLLPREKILIWQGSDGVPRNLCTKVPHRVQHRVYFRAAS